MGYDSNILGSRANEVSDGFALGSQSMRIARHNSLTSLNFDANIAKTHYFSESDDSYVDGGIEINAAYPDTKVDVTFWDAGVFWNKVSQVNIDSGQRIQPSIYGGRLSGEWLYSPKTGIVGLIQTSTTDRSRDGYSTTRSRQFRVGTSHSWGPERRWSAEYGLRESETDSGAGSDSTHHYFGLRGRGSISPKVKGDIFLGVRRSEFSGIREFSDTGPNASVDLTWNVSAQLTAGLGFESEYEFTANGSVELKTAAILKIKRELGRGLSFSTTLERGNSDYEFELRDDTRTDDFWRFSGNLEYSFTRRFFARISANLLASDSSVAGYSLDRNSVTFSSGLRY
ncbi:hypothetical protein VDG1235_2363 [Verrucomicrobiia bacterium DG1235]|nr:hypothetical protein VDG1235_2363 [Verrucomicrobiae bacterium DG1235]